MSLPLVKLRRAGPVPFGLERDKPRHFREMARVLWENRDSLPYAWRILNQGACDGCALGTSGLSDWTIDGTHLCLVRLNLLRLNTQPAAPDGALENVPELRSLTGRELRGLGRVPYPLRRRRGENGFTRVSWQEAIADLGSRLSATDPDRVAMFMTSRGITNEVYYAAQKAMRALGSPHVDNAARLCHAASTAAMKRTLGVSASTCSYADWLGTDVIVFWGSNPANDQPVAMKYLLEAKRRGTRVYVVNPYDEPGLARYWIPSDPGSALFGSTICDGFFKVATGGDLAFIQAVQRRLVARFRADPSVLDATFIAGHTEGFETLCAGLADRSDADLIAASGASAADVERLTDVLAAARTGVFVWSMGLTQHAHGSATVAALCGLGLMKGWVGRDLCGLMPIRGHSGVQGGAEMGAYATAFPGGLPVDEPNAQQLEAHWGFRPPARPGLSTAEMIDAAHAGRLDVFYNVGGNLRETLPDPARVEAALARVPVRIHQDLVLTSAMLVDPAEVVYVLPARTRYEHRGGVTQTSTERRVIFSPFIPGHPLVAERAAADHSDRGPGSPESPESPEAVRLVEGPMEEWWIPLALARAARPELGAALTFTTAADLRREIAAVIPTYRGIEALAHKGDAFQWGGRHLCVGGQFPLPGGRARFELTPLPDRRLAAGELWLATRRGKQFNSIVQADTDPLTGAARDHVLMSAEDVEALDLHQDDDVLLSSATGELRARVFIAPIARGSVQAHWPEANALLGAGVLDPASLAPDYNTRVRVARIL